MLVRRHERLVRGFLMRLAPASGAADDLAQETFLTAWSRAASFTGQGRYKGWLLRIAWTTFLMDARSRRRRIPAWKGGGEAPPPEERAVGDAEEELVVRDAMARLRVGDRAAVTLCLVLGHSHAEAAKILEAPLGTVKSRVARGTRQLLALLGEDEEEGGDV
jgi:RNA polymerase sigma-70 factor (ECF subfamily)